MQQQYGTGRSTRYRKSKPAFFLLVLFGCLMIFFAIALIACAFVINYADDFETTGGDKLEAVVQSQFNYCQYWAGIPFLITGILVLFSGIWQRSRGLTITAVVFCCISIALTLLVLAVDSSNFWTWNSAHRLKIYWDNKSGISCSSSSGDCKCTGILGNTTPTDINLLPGDCDDWAALSALYGVVIGAAVIISLFCLFSIIIVIKSVTWKQLRYVQHMYYPDEYYTPERRAPSVVQVPQTFGREYPVSEKYQMSELPYKQAVYRNYPY